MNAATFLTYYPEFAETNAILVQAKLNLAAARMGGPDFTIWGAFAAPGNTPTNADIGQAHFAAHLLMTSPFGASTLLTVPKDGKTKTQYLEAFEELELSVCGGFVVAGSVV